MSKYGLADSERYGLGLQNGTLIGDVETKGTSWWGGGHFSGAVPIDEARRLLGLSDASLRRIFDEDMPVPDLHEQLAALNGSTMSYGELQQALRNLLGIRELEDYRSVVNVHNGHVYQVASEGYVIHQYNEVLLDNVMLLIDTSDVDLHISSVTNLGRGQQAVVQVAPPDGITVGGDRFLFTVAAFTSHDGSWATGYKIVIIRIVCDNTGDAAYRGGSPMYRIKHTRNSGLKVAEARDLLGLMFDSMDDFAAEVDMLQNVEVTDRQFGVVLDKLYPLVDANGVELSDRSKTMVTTKREQVVGMYKFDMRVAPWTGSAWGVVQAVNTATQHKFTIRGTNKGITRQDRQIQSAINGKFHDVDTTTIKAINDMRETFGLSQVLTSV